MSRNYLACERCGRNCRRLYEVPDVLVRQFGAEGAIGSDSFRPMAVCKECTTDRTWFVGREQETPDSSAQAPRTLRARASQPGWSKTRKAAS